MDEFQVTSKLWPTGQVLHWLGDDVNDLGGPATFTRNAPLLALSEDGKQNYKFLFWNTGRHLTSKRKVRWNFSALGWGVWTATRWYGIPGVNGTPLITADALSIGDNAILSGTPINGPASTFHNGPQNQPAWPYGTPSNDHNVWTGWGDATIVAKDPFVPAGSSYEYDFAGWLQLIWGGDTSGDFVETDVVGGSGSSGSFYDHVTNGAFTIGQGAGATLVAAYGTKSAVTLPWFKLLVEILRERGINLDINWKVDPSPEDRVRLQILTNLLAVTSPREMSPGESLESLASGVETMSAAELKNAITRSKSMLQRGNAVLKALEVALQKAH
jgi:hypothetical protein